MNIPQCQTPPGCLAFYLYIHCGRKDFRVTQRKFSHYGKAFFFTCGNVFFNLRKNNFSVAKKGFSENAADNPLQGEVFHLQGKTFPLQGEIFGFEISPPQYRRTRRYPFQRVITEIPAMKFFRNDSMFFASLRLLRFSYRVLTVTA